jgi:small-conductance mechanosensitive channel
MDRVIGWLWEEAGLSPEFQVKVLLILLVVLTAWLGRRIVLRAVFERVSDVKSRYQWRKNTTYVAWILVILLVGRILFEGFDSIATYLGLLSAGLAIALKDLVADLAGWIFLLWRRPFEVGDRIQVGEHTGDVIDIRIFQFTLMEVGNWVGADQSTGRVVHIPNWKVFSEAQANYSKGFSYIWDEIPVLVTFESDWRGAKTLLEDIVKRHAEHLTEEAAKQVREASSQFMIFYTTLTPKVYTSVEDSGVLLTLRYLCDPRKRRGTREAIWEDILDAFASREDVDFAYPTQRFYDNRAEGKPGAAPR